MSGKGSKNKVGCSKVSKSTKAGLQFPVGRINWMLRKGRYAERIDEEAPVYITAVLDYLVAEILKLARNATGDNNKSRITPRHLQLATRNDEELIRFVACSTIAEEGMPSNINAQFLQKAIIAEEGVLPTINSQLLDKAMNDDND